MRPSPTPPGALPRPARSAARLAGGPQGEPTDALRSLGGQGGPSSRLLISALVCLAATLGSAGRLQADPRGPWIQDAATANPAQANAAASAEEWSAWIARNTRTSFNAHSAELALAALAKGIDGPRRAAALFALGAAGERAMTPRLESWALEGSPEDREAAILGLFDGGFATFELLARLARSSVAEVRDAAMLSLARSSGEKERAWFEKLCEGDGPGAEACARLRAFAQDPAAVSDCTPGRAWIQLRWDAARRYGLVDGEPWRAHMLQRLEQDSQFLDDLVYGASSEVRRLGTADSFFAIALEAGAPRRMRAVVNAIPSELDRMISAGVWYPTGQEEWAELLYGIDEKRLEGLTLDVLRQARAFPDLAPYAAMLLVRAGKLEGVAMLELDMASSDALRRLRIAETFGSSREVRYVEILEGMRGDLSAAVRATATLAQLRLGHVLAAEAVRNTLADEPGEERTAMVQAVSRLAHLPELAALLRDHVDNFGPEERLTAAIALARNGDAGQIAVLRAALGEEILRSAEGAHFVQALARVGANGDVEPLFALFPMEDLPLINVELARAMCARRDAGVLPLLRTALWQGPFDRSLLAGALMAHVAGLDSIRIELERPPRGARAVDIRRVGYALGEWGGTIEVERLARRRTAADPALQGALLGALGARTR